MNEFIQDVIHMTRMEFFLKYWWLELLTIALMTLLYIGLFAIKAWKITKRKQR